MKETLRVSLTCWSRDPPRARTRQDGPRARKGKNGRTKNEQTSRSTFRSSQTFISASGLRARPTTKKQKKKRCKRRFLLLTLKFQLHSRTYVCTEYFVVLRIKLLVCFFLHLVGDGIAPEESLGGTFSSRTEAELCRELVGGHHHVLPDGEVLSELLPGPARA